MEVVKHDVEGQRRQSLTDFPTEIPVFKGKRRPSQMRRSMTVSRLDKSQSMFSRLDGLEKVQLALWQDRAERKERNMGGRNVWFGCWVTTAIYVTEVQFVAVKARSYQKREDCGLDIGYTPPFC
jgi:hypothetical protein